MCDDLFNDGEGYEEDFMEEEPLSDEWDGVDEEFREPGRKTVSRICDGPKAMDWEEFAFALGLGYELSECSRSLKRKIR